MPPTTPDLTSAPIAITGSVATDHLMTFGGRWSELLLADRLAEVSISVLVDDLAVRRGGVAANISYGLARLGQRPVLVASVGVDFETGGYRDWLDAAGVDTADIRVTSNGHTPRFTCTTDAEQNQIASFYPGAMSEAREIALAPIADRVGGLSLVLIGPNDPQAMVRHTEEARSLGLAFAADVSQQLAIFEGPGLRDLVEGAAYLFTNSYERDLLLERTGWTEGDVLGRVGAWVTTLGANGVRVDADGQTAVTVPVAPAGTIADPTGVGDAFRSGFLAGCAWGLPLERALQVGSQLATLSLETVGPQEYVVDPAAFAARFASSYGEEAAADVRPHLPTRG